MDLVITSLCVLGGMLGMGIGLYMLIKAFMLLLSQELTTGFKMLGMGLLLSALAAISFFVPVIVDSYCGLKISRCREHLCQFGKALDAYSQEHGGERPTSFMQLTNYLDRGCITEIVVRHDGLEECRVIDPLYVIADYIVVTNVTNESLPFEVQAYCPPEHHRGAICNVLYANGYVSSIRRKEFCVLTCDVVGHSRVNDKKQAQPRDTSKPHSPSAQGAEGR